MYPTLILVTLLALQIESCLTKRPNIVIILADDLGFSDVSFRGSDQFLTPNIDALAYNGAILNNYYVPSMCTPSRAALLTGKYPINTGMQHYVISNNEPWSLPVNERTMAEIFREAGYRTALIGKWHLGFSKSAYTPTRRGFDSHYGYLGAYIDYNQHILYDQINKYSGHDMRQNLNISHENTDRYATDIFTGKAVEIIEKMNEVEPLLMIVSHLAPHTGNSLNPLQAPQIEINKFSYISDENRRTYAAMVSILDESVGMIIGALDSKGVLNETILIFYSDNGAPSSGEHRNFGSNYPLRGQKKSPWEGGIRSSGIIWSGNLRTKGIVLNQTLYAADWLPTLAAAAEIHLNSTHKIDGLNLWPQIVDGGVDNVEREIVHNIDDITGYVSYTSGPWKYINGTTDEGIHDGWLGYRPSLPNDPRAKNYANTVQSTPVWKSLAALNPLSDKIAVSNLRKQATVVCRGDQNATRCDPLKGECLFHLPTDPCEQHNLREEYKDNAMLKRFREAISNFRKNAVPPANQPGDPRCDPKLHNGEWTFWEDMLQKNKATTAIDGGFLLKFLLIIYFL